MTTVTGALLVGGGRAPADAGMLARLTVSPVAVTPLTSGLLLPQPESVVVASDGTWTATCLALPAGYAYKFKAILGGGAYEYTRTVIVPASGTVELQDLPDVVAPTAPYMAPPIWATDAMSAAEAAAISEINAALSATNAAASLAAMNKGGADGVAPLDGAALLPEANVPTRLTATVQNATMAARWQPFTAYALGFPVVNPSGDLVTAIAAFTSAASYVPADWTISPVVASKANLWQPTTAYGVGALVVSPTGDIVSAKAAHTSGASYTDTNWNGAPRTAPRGDMFMGCAVALKNAYNSFGIQATGDSTTTPDTAWFRLLANQTAAAYPTLTHHYRKWNDTTQDNDRPIVLNTGAAGRRAMVTATGGTRTGVRFDGTTNITGDIDVRANIKLPSYVTGSSQVVVAKYDTDDSWYFQVGGDGKLYYNWSTDGTTFIGSKASTVVLPYAANAEAWIRVVHDVDNGSAGNDVKFYTSSDGAAWTQLGTTVTTAGVTSLFASVSRYSLGARGSSSTPLVDGSRIYEVQIRDGINGASVVPYLPDMWELSIGTGVPTFEGAPVVTWIMAGQPGAGLGYDAQTVGYLSDPVRMRKMSPNFNQLAMFYSTSHNDYTMHGNLWITKLTTWVNATSVDKLAASRIMLTQNPRTGAGALDAGPRIRRGEVLAWAKRFPVSAIDTYQAFIDDGRDLTTVLISDGTHPTSAGYQVWAAAVWAELNAALSRVTTVG